MRAQDLRDPVARQIWLYIGAIARSGSGPRSRELHAASGARELSGEGLLTLRRDVDDLLTLAHTVELGCGRHTVASLLGITSRFLELEATG